MYDEIFYWLITIINKQYKIIVLMCFLKLKFTILNHDLFVKFGKQFQ